MTHINKSKALPLRSLFGKLPERLLPKTALPLKLLTEDGKPSKGWAKTKFNSTALLCALFFFLFGAAGNCFCQSVGGTTTGALTFCSTSNSGFVTVTGYVGNILNWQSSTNGGVTWNSNVNTTPNQTYFNLNQTTCYRAIVKNGAFPPDTSTIVCISISSQSFGGTVSGGGTFCAGSGAGTLTLTGSTGNVIYWQYSTNGGSSWLTIANTSATLNYTNITQNTLYWAVVQSDPGCPADTSTQASFIIDPATVPGTITGATTVCAAGNSGNLTLSGYTGAILGWESSINSGGVWTPISNGTASEAYLNLTQPIWYRARVKSGSCIADTTANFVINVSPATVGGTLSGGGVYCGVPATGTLTLAGYFGTISSWASSANNGITWIPIANTTAAENYTNLSVTKWYKVIVQSGSCLADTSNIMIVSVAPQTAAGTIALSSTACLGSNLDTLLLSGNIGNITGWISSVNSGVSWSPISNTTSSQIYSGLTQTTWYAAIVQSGACSIDTTQHVIITVVAQPAVSAGNDAAITQGQSIVLGGSGTGTPLWSPASGLSDPSVFSPTASPNSTVSYILTVTDINGCISSDTIVITVTQSVFRGKVSNLFTPNGDGINEYWYIEGIQNVPDCEVFVYNIYGKEVYSKKGYNNDWQGTYNGAELPDGTYYYIIKFENSDRIRKGSLDILRSK